MRGVARLRLACAVAGGAAAAAGGGLALASCVSKPLDLGHDNTVEVQVLGAIDTTAGIDGAFQEFIGTSFQPADWQWDFFARATPANTVESLSRLAPKHVVVQLMNGGAIPLVVQSWPTDPSARSASDWDFTELDAIMNNVLSYAGDAGAEVELQIAQLPNAIPDLNTEQHVQWYGEYCADLVGYFNADGGFLWGDAGFHSDAGVSVPWWAVYSEPNGALGEPEFVQMYDSVVPAMQSVDSTIRFAAFEFNDYFVPNTPDAPNSLSWIDEAFPTAQIDAVSLHIFGTQYLTMHDAQLFAEVPGVPSDLTVRSFVNDVTNVIGIVQKHLGTSTRTPVWITEDNVNSDYPSKTAEDMSYATGGPFADDPRGTSAFFAAWRPYVFSQLGKAGAQGLVHWSFTSGSCPSDESAGNCLPPPPGSGITPQSLDTDIQNAEVDYETGRTYLSYWVDYELSQMFPITATGPKILQLGPTPGASGQAGVEILATQNDDGSVVVMVVDISPASPNDVNGPGAPINVDLDLTNLVSASDASSTPAFTKAFTLTIDAHTDLVNGPSLETQVPPTAANPKVTMALGGYGVAFLKLQK